jgi:hypothetical protein
VRLAIVPGAYYNLACAHARLGNVSAAVQNLGVACGYDVQMVGLARADADFDGIRETHAFNSVLWEYEPGRVVETYVFQIRALDYGIGLRFAGAEAKKHWVELVKSTAYVPTGDTARWSEATEELAEVITDEPMEEVVRYCQDQVFIAPDDIVELLEFPESCVVTFDYGLRVEVWPLAPYR